MGGIFLTDLKSLVKFKVITDVEWKYMYLISNNLILKNKIAIYFIFVFICN